MKFLSHWSAVTDNTSRGKTDGNHTSASHVVGCVEFAPEKYRGLSTCATRMRDTGDINNPMVTKVCTLFRQRTGFSAAFCILMLRPLPIARIVFSVQAPLKVVIRAGTRFNDGVAHYPIDSGAFNPGFSFRWPMFHNHAFADPVPPQSTHEDARFGVGERD